MNGSHHTNGKKQFSKTNVLLRPSKIGNSSRRRMCVFAAAILMANVNIFFLLRRSAWDQEALMRNHGNAGPSSQHNMKLQHLSSYKNNTVPSSMTAAADASSALSRPRTEEDAPRTNLVKNPSESDETHVIDPKLLPIFWINLDAANKKRQTMEQNLQQFQDSIESSTRITAITKNEAQKIWSKKGLLLQDITLAHPSREPSELKHLRGEYLYEEAASLISHLTMIQTAYDTGYEYALFLNDNVILTKEFIENWKPYMEFAPNGWKALQWTTSNGLIREQGMRLQDPWITWQPSHWSTAAFMLSRNGMENILRQTHSISDDGKSVLWHVDESKLVSPDEVIYFLAGNAYTSTYPWFDIPTVGGDTKTPPIANLTQPIPSPLPDRVLVFTTIGIRSLASIPGEVERLRQDIHAFSQWHSNSTWVVNVVVKSKSLLVQILKYLKDFKHANVRMHPRVVKGNFNKFSFLKPFVNMLSDYDYFLMKDSDIRLAGFAWRSFLQKAHQSVITGPLYETTEESLFRNSASKPTRQNQFTDGKWWKEDGNSWPGKKLAAVSAFPVPWVETFLTLIEADFAMSFFEKVLVEEVVTQPSDYGVDLMWCAAAAERLDPNTSKKQACQLVPIIATHDNTQQIQIREVTNGQSYMEALGKIKDFLWYSMKFGNWMKRSDPWRSLIDGRTVHSVIRHCKSLQAEEPSDNFNYLLDGCADENERLSKFNQQNFKERNGVLLPDNYLENLYVYKRGE